MKSIWQCDALSGSDEPEWIDGLVQTLLEAALRCAPGSALLRCNLQSWIQERAHRKALPVQTATGSMPQTTDCMLIRPGGGCNLSCRGCCANARMGEGPNLDWRIVDRLLRKAKSVWQHRFFIISGGEPFLYHSYGRSILDLTEAHPDCLFMLHTNGTLINECVAERLAKSANTSLLITLDGLQDKTDRRRGRGVFRRALCGMQHAQHAGVPFGVSVMATSGNMEEILSDAFLELIFEQLGAAYGWVIPFMPLCRRFSLDRRLNPEQHHRLLIRMQELRRDHIPFLEGGPKVALVDWESVLRDPDGGTLASDWRGDARQRDFRPVSTPRIHQLYAPDACLRHLHQGMDPWNARGLRVHMQAPLDLLNGGFFGRTACECTS